MATCFWCKRAMQPSEHTREHLIPQWACRLFYVQLGYAHDRENVVKACKSCNAAKGGMPPALYYEVRTKSGERKLASVNWHKIQEQACVAWISDQGVVDPLLRAYIIEEMLKPVPGHAYEQHPSTSAQNYEPMSPHDVALLNIHVPKGAKGEPFSKNKPLKRLAYTCGAVANQTVLDHEKLNENLEGVR